jgi:hypothetical protein
MLRNAATPTTSINQAPMGPGETNVLLGMGGLVRAYIGRVRVSLNTRPRQTPGDMTPSNRLAQT